MWKRARKRVSSLLNFTDTRPGPLLCNDDDTKQKRKRSSSSWGRRNTNNGVINTLQSPRSSCIIDTTTTIQQQHVNVTIRQAIGFEREGTISRIVSRSNREAKFITLEGTVYTFSRNYYDENNNNEQIIEAVVDFAHEYEVRHGRVDTYGAVNLEWTAHQEHWVYINEDDNKNNKVVHTGGRTSRVRVDNMSLTLL